MSSSDRKTWLDAKKSDNNRTTMTYIASFPDASRSRFIAGYTSSNVARTVSRSSRGALSHRMLAAFTIDNGLPQR